MTQEQILRLAELVDFVGEWEDENPAVGSEFEYPEPPTR